jgi:hypothetical protein
VESPLDTQQRQGWGTGVGDPFVKFVVTEATQETELGKVSP